MPSNAQIIANQANSELSTGPTSEQGKATVSKNALKTGLTGRTILLPSDDAELYAAHIESFRARFNPVGDAETELVRSIADTAWRAARIPQLESALWALGFVKLGDLHPEEKDEQHRSFLIEAEILLTYERQIRNLQIQEARLDRRMAKDTAALKTLQQNRKSEDGAQLEKAAKLLTDAIKNGKGRSFDPAEFGFEFSIGEIEQQAAKSEPKLIAAYIANKPRHLRNAA